MVPPAHLHGNNHFPVLLIAIILFFDSPPALFTPPPEDPQYQIPHASPSLPPSSHLYPTGSDKNDRNLFSLADLGNLCEFSSSCPAWTFDTLGYLPLHSGSGFYTFVYTHLTSLLLRQSTDEPISTYFHYLPTLLRPRFTASYSSIYLYLSRLSLLPIPSGFGTINKYPRSSPQDEKNTPNLIKSPLPPPSPQVSVCMFIIGWHNNIICYLQTHLRFPRTAGSR